MLRQLCHVVLFAYFSENKSDCESNCKIIRNPIVFYNMFARSYIIWYCVGCQNSYVPWRTSGLIQILYADDICCKSSNILNRWQQDIGITQTGLIVLLYETLKSADISTVCLVWVTQDLEKLTCTNQAITRKLENRTPSNVICPHTAAWYSLKHGYEDLC